MKLAFWTLPCCALALFLSSCGNKASSAGGPDIYGPFDEHGNYREDWADNPKKWRKSKGTTTLGEAKPDYLPPVASNNDLPPENSVPLPPKSSKPAPVISKTEVTERPKVSERAKASKATKKSSERKSEPVVVKTTPKTKSKSSAATVKTKVKPKTVRYVVKKGDSLSSIASRTGVSVAAIKSANEISGTLIRPGQSLTIPKK